MKIVDWIARVVVAVVLLQSLSFKFLGATESVYIFERLGVEPWGRFATGMIELASAVLIVVPRTAWLGALAALGMMTGAIFSHLLLLGIVVQDDGGMLFALALLVFAGSLTALVRHRAEIPFLTGRRDRRNADLTGHDSAETFFVGR